MFKLFLLYFGILENKLDFGLSVFIVKSNLRLNFWTVEDRFHIWFVYITDEILFREQ